MLAVTRILAVAILAALPMAAAARQSSAPSPQIHGPQVVFEQESFDFGSIYDDKPVMAKFLLRNVGDAPLRVDRVRPLCQCVTFVKPAKLTFAPGESGELAMVFDPSMSRGGVQAQTVEVRTNASGDFTRLYIRGTVKQLVEISPLVARFGWARPAEKKSIKVTVIGRTPEFKVTAAKLLRQPDFFQVSIGAPEPLDLRDEKGAKVIVEVTLNGMTAGDFVDELEFTTNDPRKPAAKVTVTGYVGDGPPPKRTAEPVMTHDGKPIDPKQLSNDEIRDHAIKNLKDLPSSTPVPAPSTTDAPKPENPKKDKPGA